MEQILIEVDTKEDKELLLALLPKLNSRVVNRPSTAQQATSSSSFGDILDQLSKTNIAEKYGDPSDWQRETRQDKPLAGREE